MKRYLIFFSKSEAFLKFQYMCENIKISPITNNIVVANFMDKEVIIIFLKKNNEEYITKGITPFINRSQELFIINFKNKLMIDIDYLDLFKEIQSKSHEYYENKIFSCNHQRLELTIKSMLKGISLDVARKNLAFELKMAEQKKQNLTYFNDVINMVKLNMKNKLIYDVLYIVYAINNTQHFLTKSIFHSKDSKESLEKTTDYYTKTLNILKDLYIKEVTTYPFEEECEVINSNKILQEEKSLIQKLIEEPHSILIYEKNSIQLSDIAYLYHLENEDFVSDSFIRVINFCIEKNILYFMEGRIYMTKNGERLYSSIMEKELEKYLLKGF